MASAMQAPELHVLISQAYAARLATRVEEVTGRKLRFPREWKRQG